MLQVETSYCIYKYYLWYYRTPCVRIFRIFISNKLPKLKIQWYQHVNELYQTGYCLSSSVIRVLARIAEVSDSNLDLDMLHSFGENLFNFDLHLQQYVGILKMFAINS